MRSKTRVAVFAMLILAIGSCQSTGGGSQNSDIESVHSSSGAVFKNLRCSNSSSSVLKMDRILPSPGDLIKYSRRSYPWVADITVIKAIQNAKSNPGDSKIRGCYVHSVCPVDGSGNVEIEIHVSSDSTAPSDSNRRYKVSLVKVIPDEALERAGPRLEEFKDSCTVIY